MFARFRILASLVSAKEYVAVSSGRKCAQLTLQVDDNLFRADLYNTSSIDEALALLPGTKLAVTGRLTGRQNDRGYFNYSIYADDFVPIPEAPQQPQQQPQQRAVTPPQQPRLSDADIPF